MWEVTPSDLWDWSKLKADIAEWVQVLQLFSLEMEEQSLLTFDLLHTINIYMFMFVQKKLLNRKPFSISST